MKTETIYLNDPYITDSNAKILDIIQENNNTYRVILNKTIFYPMGGGQPTDQGFLINEKDNKEWEVNQVLIKDGEINHYVICDGSLNIGDNVKLKLNWDRRYKNMKMHSAGHIIDFAMYLLGYSPKTLTPIKGDHGKKPFIIYQGIINEDIREKLENKANELVEKNLKFSWYFEPLEELEKEAIYLQPGLPTNKPLRALKLEDIGVVADGGTQVKSTKEVGKIKITSIETKDNNTIINYSLEN